jgi:hypothetical protein
MNDNGRVTVSIERENRVCLKYALAIRDDGRE